MKTTAELKAEAKNALRGKWKQAILLNLIPTLLIVSVFLFGVLSWTIWFFTHETDAAIVSAISESIMDEGFLSLLSSMISAVFLSGISWTYLDLIRRERSTIEPLKDVFRGFKGMFLGGVILLSLLFNIFTSLWMILFLIPGVVKSYAYSQCYFIYYDQIQLTGKKPKALDSITASRQLMDGHKRRLFWLDITFLGWYILSAVTFGIAYLWVAPYVSATRAAFYEDLQKNI